MDALATSLKMELERLRALPPMRPASFYITTIFGLSGLAVGAMLLLMVLRPEADNTAIIVGLFGFLAPIIAAILAIMVKDVHTVVNSRMDALLIATERAASAEGKAAGHLEALDERPPSPRTTKPPSRRTALGQEVDDLVEQAQDTVESAQETVDMAEDSANKKTSVKRKAKP